MQQIGEEGEISRKGMSKAKLPKPSSSEPVKGRSKARTPAASAGPQPARAPGAAASAFSAFESGHDLILDKGTGLEIRLDRNRAIR